MNMVLHPSFESVMFWDMIALNGYLLLNVVISMVTLKAERNSIAPLKMAP